MYVLAIDLASLLSLDDRTIWRFPDDEAAALEQWYNLQSLVDFGGLAKDCGENVALKAARLYLAGAGRAMRMRRATPCWPVSSRSRIPMTRWRSFPNRKPGNGVTGWDGRTPEAPV